jgi:hypothetical protein
MPCGFICTNIYIGESVIASIKQNGKLPKSICVCTGENLSNWNNFWEEFRSEFGAVEKEVVRAKEYLAPVTN